MQLILVASLTSVAMAVSAPGTPATAEKDAVLEWSQHYAQAKQMAEQEHRPLLVVVEDLSSPEGRFAQESLASKPQQLDLLKQYRLCRMDVNTAYGKRVADAFGANKFPMTVITDKSAKFVAFRSDGEMAPEAWQQTLTSQLDDEAAPVTSAQPPVEYESAQPQRVEAFKVITPWPIQSQPSSNCPNCIRNQQSFYYQ